jgi:methyltransferase (TIGR00027 family)
MIEEQFTNKPSKTALMAAVHRTLANKEYGHEVFGSDYMAIHFLPPHFRFFLGFKKIRKRIKNKIKRKLPGLHEYVLARTAWLDSLFTEALQNKIPQIVILGAGYDSRAYRFDTINQVTKIFELDKSSTQDRKKRCLRKAGINISQNTCLIPIDFIKESLPDTLHRAGYDPDKKTLFIWEGVSYYLSPDAVEATLGYINERAQKETVVAFDYIIPVSENNMDHYYGVKEFFRMMQKNHADEILRFSMPEDETTSFLKRKGLRVLDHYNNDEIESNFLSRMDGSISRQITGHFRFVTASPDK